MGWTMSGVKWTGGFGKESPFLTIRVEYGKTKIVGNFNKSTDGHFGTSVRKWEASCLTYHVHFIYAIKHLLTY